MKLKNQPTCVGFGEQKKNHQFGSRSKQPKDSGGIVKTSKTFFGIVTLSVFVFVLAATAGAGQPLPGDMRDGASMRAEIDRQMRAADAAAAASVTGGSLSGSLMPAATPEKEMERRRKLINEGHLNFMNIAADTRAPVGSDSLETSSAGGRSMGELPVLDEEGRRSPAREGLKGADARAEDDGQAVLAASKSDRMLPAPPRAVGVEGRVVIEGSQADARSPRDPGLGVRYTVEERFVGNLIIADAEPQSETDIIAAVGRRKLQPDEGAPASARDERDNEPARATQLKRTDAGSLLDYSLDTISAGVKVTSLGGGACLRSDGRRDGACAEQDPFTKSNVSGNNSYGQFHDGVVTAARSGDKVKIEASAPEVAFSTSRGKAKKKLECSKAIFEIEADEFSQLVKSGSMTLTKQVGDATATSGCRPGSTVTLYMRVNEK